MGDSDGEGPHVSDKTRENRVRRMAKRQGYQLVKSRRREQRSIDYGTFVIVDPSTNTLVLGGHVLHNLAEVEAWLSA